MDVAWSGRMVAETSGCETSARGVVRMKASSVAALVASFLASAVQGADTHKGGITEFNPGTLELGSVGYGDRLVGRTMIKNVGNGDLHIQNVRSKCACYKASISQKASPLSRRRPSR
jgi:hypothetical protein